jgi:hypothetical protein
MWATLASLKIAQAAPCEARYSNFGFGVLGELLAERYGKPWAELVQRTHHRAAEHAQHDCRCWAIRRRAWPRPLTAP